MAALHTSHISTGISDGSCGGSDARLSGRVGTSALLAAFCAPSARPCGSLAARSRAFRPSSTNHGTGSMSVRLPPQATVARRGVSASHAPHRARAGKIAAAAQPAPGYAAALHSCAAKRAAVVSVWEAHQR
eukprot:365847-Chlamydomonas_euryale.AAC.23